MLFPLNVYKLGKYNSSITKDVQFPNELPLIVVTDSGRFIVVKLVQLEKALASIVVNVEGRFTLCKLVQPKNA